MLPQQVPFIINDSDDNKINSEAIEILSSSKRPFLIIIYGKAQTGKSSILNQLINGPSPDYYCNKGEPIKIEHTTNINLIGPYKLKDLQERMNVSLIKEHESNEIFFVDTEGTDFPYENIGLLTLLNVSTISIYVNDEIPYASSIQNILESIECCYFIHKIFPIIRNESICQPFLYIPINDIPNKTLNDFTRMKEYIQTRTEKISEIISLFDNNLLVTQYLSIISIPEYVPNEEIITKKVENDLYWNKIRKLFSRINNIIINKKHLINGKTLCEQINLIFSLFKSLSKTKDFQKIISFVKTECNDNINEYIDELKTDFIKCFKFIKNTTFAKEEIQNIRNDNKLMPNFIKEFIINNIIILQNELKIWINQETELIETKVMSKNNIKTLLKSRKNKIINNETIEELWNKEKQKYKNFFVFIEKEKNEKYEILHKKFLIEANKQAIKNKRESFESIKNNNKVINSFARKEGIKINDEVSIVLFNVYYI